MEPRIMMARLMMLGSIACGVIGLIVAFADRNWKLGVEGWFAGGALLALVALLGLADQYFESRRQT